MNDINSKSESMRARAKTQSSKVNSRVFMVSLVLRVLSLFIYELGLVFLGVNAEVDTRGKALGNHRKMKKLNVKNEKDVTRSLLISQVGF